jgi:hypothetical protein
VIDSGSIQRRRKPAADRAAASYSVGLARISGH